MKLNNCKTYSITISRSRTAHLTLLCVDLAWRFLAPISFYELHLMINLLLKIILVILPLILPKKIGLIRKCYKTLGNNNAVLKSFYTFILLALSTFLLFGLLHMIRI